MEDVESLKSALSSKFSMKDIGELQNFLGINIERKGNSMMLSTRNTWKISFVVSRCRTATLLRHRWKCAPTWKRMEINIV